ncbi:O-acetyltransferase [Aspergillus ibericus CBS 121593]|uniref:O-acetyltransferase n=1 Tax=Aspergillus ibericus CBS 121593 TaxID=1448316 RepID=A0A395HBD3_9EURO|nr:O-acetyltransferase [Aspergillus ibericus CBS 121593]RAL04966.1 O-acetyltransferase [Aspergillus ibericus CBS 121593]
MAAEIPSFQPYILTPLDHLVPPSHALFYLSFQPKHPSEAITAIRMGIAHLVSQWPFLAGNVARIQKGDKRNISELQPPTAFDLLRYPILQVKHHQQSISHAMSRPVINDELLHIPTKVPITYPIPAVRFQANIMQDGIVLCLGWHHQVMDAVGVSILLGSLSRCCRGLDQKNALPRWLPTDTKHEGRSRRQIEQATTPNRAVREGAYHRIGCEEIWKGSSEPLVCRRYAMQTDKVNYLKDSCNKLIHDLARGAETREKLSDGFMKVLNENDHVSSDDVVTALTWLCVSRAHRRVVSRHSSELPRMSSLTRLVEARTILQPPLPRSYLGNSLVAARTQCDWDEIPASQKGHHIARKGGQVDEEIINALLKLALRSRAKCNSIDDEHIRGLINRMKNCDDYTSLSIAPGITNISSLRKLDLFGWDWGSKMGPMVDFDTLDGRTDGLCLILPSRSANPGQSIWEIRITLSSAVMEEFERDALLGWVTETGKPSVQAMM